MAARIAAHDWSATSLGPRAAWPAALDVTLDLCLASSVPSAVYWGAQFRAFYNDASAVLIGDRHPAALGAPGEEMWPEAWIRLSETFARIVATGGSVTGVEVPLVVRRDGGLETIWLNYSFTPIRDRGGPVLGVFTQASDATAGVRAKDALATSQERLRLALTASNSIGIWDWDVAADRATADPRFAELLGVPAEHTTSGTARIADFLDRVHPDDRDAINAAFVRTLRTGADFEAEYRILTPSRQERWLVARGSCRFDDGKPVRFSGVSFEFTRRKRAELGLRRAKEERDFVLSLTEGQRAQPDADGIMQMTAEAMARRLGVSRAGFFRMTDKGETIVYGACWTDGRVSPLIGRVPAERLGRHVRNIASRGMTLVYGDLARDPQVTDSGFAAIEARAGIGVPLVRGGQWNGSFYLSEPCPRTWTAEEIALVEEVAQLSWDAVARAEALAELRAHNRALAGQVEATVEQRDQQLAALLEAEELSRLAMASVNGVGTWNYDIASDRLVVDAGFARLYAIDPERGAAGVPIAEAMRHIHPDDGEAVVAKLASNRTVGFGEGEYRLLDPDGSIRWVLSRTRTIAGAQGAAATAIGVVLDVTAQRALEEQLRQAQKMEAVGQLTGGLAHDFNNLLTGISGAMELMQVRLGQGRYEALPAYIEAAQGATRRAAALTHRLLAFSRRQTLDPRPTDVNRLIGEIEDLVRRSVGPGVRVEVDADPALAVALIDANQLENALLNLCLNARDAMAGTRGGTGAIRIVTRNVTLTDGACEELDVAPGGYLRLDIVDSGRGMSPQVAARAFDPFFTTKPMGEGTGLGLSMIYGFARQSGGQIAIHSAKGRGTTMSLYLPRHAGAADAAPADSGGGPPRRGAGRTVLVVDDEAGVRMLVNEALTELDYAVIEAEDGAGAVMILASDARIDLLVTDVGLPGGINGRQVAEAARAARPSLGVLFITGYAEHAVIGNAPLEAGMELLTKPFTIEALGARVADMVAR